MSCRLRERKRKDQDVPRDCDRGKEPVSMKQKAKGVTGGTVGQEALQY